MHRSALNPSFISSAAIRLAVHEARDVRTVRNIGQLQVREHVRGLPFDEDPQVGGLLLSGSILTTKHRRLKGFLVAFGTKLSPEVETSCMLCMQRGEQGWTAWSRQREPSSDRSSGCTQTHRSRRRRRSGRQGVYEVLVVLLLYTL